MNCQECREELAAYLEGLLDETCQSRMDGHLAECTACQAELREVRELMVRLTRDGLAVPPVSLETAVMDRILYEQALEIRRLKMRKRIRVLGLSGAMAAAAAMFVVSGLWLTQPATAQKAAGILARGAEAAPNPSTVHIVAKMRTAAAWIILAQSTRTSDLGPIEAGGSSATSRNGGWRSPAGWS